MKHTIKVIARAILWSLFLAGFITTLAMALTALITRLLNYHYGFVVIDVLLIGTTGFSLGYLLNWPFRDKS